MVRQHAFIGIGFLLVSTLAFTIMAAFIRYLGGRVPLGEVVFARSFFALIPLLGMLQWRGELRSAFRTRNPTRHVTRGLAGIAGMFSNFAALARLPLADATAIGFATPLINVALAAIFLGEKVRIFRWAAVFVGFLGVLVMLSPHLGGAERNETTAAGGLFAIAGAFLVSAAMTQVRQMSRTETTASLVFSFTVLSTIAGLATITWGWIKPTPWDSVVLVAIGVFGGIGQITITESYRHASAGTVAPFSYMSMIYSLLIGYFFFAEVPEVIVLMGAALVVIAGLFVIYRERELRIDRTRERKAETPAGSAV
jgi:drug/metabolite transporter (DMT)-like permease